MAVAIALLTGCASSPKYRAEPLTRFVPNDFEQTTDGDVDVVAGRLTNESDVARVLGPTSSRLATAAVLQLRIEAGVSAARVMPDSFELVLATGATVRPLSSGMVMAAVSGSYSGPRGGLASAPSTGNGKQVASKEEAYFELAFVALLSAASVVAESVARSGPEKYWAASRADVERKTGLPRDIKPGESLDLLVVFWPREGEIPTSWTLAVTVELTRNGRACRERLTLVHS